MSRFAHRWQTARRELWWALCRGPIADWHARRIRRRIESDEPFQPKELVYSRVVRCPCGSGLAYPKHAPKGHYWDCAAVLTHTADETIEHCQKYPFVFWSFNVERGELTTRPQWPPAVGSPPAAPPAEG